MLPNGKVDTDVGWGQPQRERVIPDWVASTVTQVLEQNMLYGTGTGAHLSGHTDAGKTGTTDNYADAWFSGYTPRLEATVWIGYPSGEIPMLDVHGIAVSGPTFPASIWHLYMETAVGKKPDVPFAPPLTQPVWAHWQGQYEYSGSYGTDHRDDDRDDDGEVDADDHGSSDDHGDAEGPAAAADDPAGSGDHGDGAAAAADDGRDADRHDAAAVMSREPDLLTFEEAQARVLAHARPLPGETVPIERAGGRVTADAARAAVDLPPFPSSAMDGYAVRAVDVPGTLPVVARIAAGRPAARRLESGEAMSISTGGVVPEGADSVVPVEYVVQHDNSIDVAGDVVVGAHVRPRGGDVRAGDIVVEAGVRLGPAQLGGLAAAGVADLRCARAPRVAVLSTGTELARPGEPLGPGQVYEANAIMLAAALAAAGGDIEVLPAVADDESALAEALERGLAADVLVTSGGVSVGPHDLVRRIEAELGVEEVFWRVAIKPGKPVSFGVRGETLVFGLPGNPVSSLVGCELFVKPALRALLGLPAPLPEFEPGRLAAPLRRNDARDELVRARSRVDQDGRRARARVGPGVAHDRPRGGRGRARARSARDGRARRRSRRSLAPARRRRLAGLSR